MDRSARQRTCPPRTRRVRGGKSGIARTPAGFPGFRGMLALAASTPFNPGYEAEPGGGGGVSRHGKARHRDRPGSESRCDRLAERRATPPNDHPHVFLDLGGDREIICPYCSTLYRFDPALAHNAARPPECALRSRASGRQRRINKGEVRNMSCMQTLSDMYRAMQALLLPTAFP
jgi:hypothetical protein